MSDDAGIFGPDSVAWRIHADPAMLAFYDEWERLRHEHVAGELLLVYRGDEARTLLREPLG